MKTNLFKFRYLKENKIVLEEENKDSAFLSFFKKYGKYLILLIMLLAIIFLVIGLYSVIKNLNESTKEYTNISTVVVEFEDTNKFNSLNMKPITGGIADKLFYERYGNIGLMEGVILVVKEIESKNGLVTFYSDGSAKIENNDGSIVRVSALENGDYGINENGVIILGAKTKEIKITDTKVLEDETKLIYYSDNSASVIMPGKKVNMLVRNSERIVCEDNRLKEISPSGISKEEKTDKEGNIKVTYYEDGTIKIIDRDKTYIVRSEDDFDIINGDVVFPNNNSASILRDINLEIDEKIIYYTDGSAEIIKANESIMVRASKDIIYTEKGIVEIIDTKYAKEIYNRVGKNVSEIKYLDNGGALIKNINGTYEYAYENSDLKYDSDGNLRNDSNTMKQKNSKVTPDGTLVVDLEDGKSVIVSEDGYRIVDTDKIVYDGDGNIVRIIGDTDDVANVEGSVSDNRFVINNVSGNTIRYMITIEVSSNYEDYAPRWLNPEFLRFNIVENANYLENQEFGQKMEIGTVLEGNTIIQKDTYILYEATLENGQEANINLGIWLDYEDITNEYQDSVFVGTIKVYTETIN